MGPALRGAAVIQGGQRHPPLQSKTGTVQSGTSRTPSPTHSVIARSEVTRQSVLPSPKRRIPTPVSALARNGSASRCRDVGDAVPYEGGRTDPRTGVRRGTWAPPYGAQRSCGADRVARRDGISAGTRAVEHQGTHRGSGQRRATAHRGKLWRHNPLNREKPGNRLRVGQVSAKS